MAGILQDSYNVDPKPATITHSGSTGDRRQSITVPIGNRSQAICGPIVPVMVTVGTALMEIRVKRLYRGKFDTFEEYCQSKWGFSRQFANKTIESSGIASGLETIVSISNGATAEQFVKVFCADHPQVSVCPKKAATITHSGSAGEVWSICHGAG